VGFAYTYTYRTKNRREKPTKGGGKLQTVDTLDSASTRSAVEGDPGCPELDLQPGMHIMDDFKNSSTT